MADQKKQQLVLAFIDFLDESIQDGTVKEDDKEGLEVASALARCPHPTARRFTLSSPMHRRGLWHRSIRRCTTQAAQHQASKAADHIRGLPQDER